MNGFNGPDMWVDGFDRHDFWVHGLERPRPPHLIYNYYIMNEE